MAQLNNASCAPGVWKIITIPSYIQFVRWFTRPVRLESVLADTPIEGENLSGKLPCATEESVAVETQLGCDRIWA